MPVFSFFFVFLLVDFYPLRVKSVHWHYCTLMVFIRIIRDTTLTIRSWVVIFFLWKCLLLHVDSIFVYYNKKILEKSGFFHFWQKIYERESVSTLPHSGISKSEKENKEKNGWKWRRRIFWWNIEGGARVVYRIFYIPCVKTSFVEHKVCLYSTGKNLYLQKNAKKRVSIRYLHFFFFFLKSRNVNDNILNWHTTHLLKWYFLFCFLHCTQCVQR